MFTNVHKSSTSTVLRLFHKQSYISTTPVRRPAGGRKKRTILGQLLDIVRCPVKFRHYLKFHGARTAFCRIIEGKMTLYNARPAFAHIGRAPDDFAVLVWNFNRTISTATVRCLQCARNFLKSLNKSKDACPGTARCQAGHRPMVYESICHR